MNNLDKQYQTLLETILEYGVEKGDRTGTGTKSIFGYTIRHNMSDGFPLLTTKKMAVKTMMTELKWFLKGDTNIKYLVDNGCNIWNGDAYKNYQQEGPYSVEVENEENTYRQLTQEEFINEIKTDDEFAKEWGELGPIYGKQWREWKTQVSIPTTLKVDDGDDSEPLFVRGTRYIDQIENLINDLKTNPDSRRLMVSAWNVGDMGDMVLPPCHYGFQVYTRELNLDERIDIHNGSSDPLNRSSDYFHEHMDIYGVPRRSISLMWNQRSVDTFLGLPFNIASYGMLLSLIAKEVNMVPEELIGNLGDTHLYQNHIEHAEEQLTREPFPHLPKLKLGNVDILNGEFDYEILYYHSHPTIKAPLSN
jgi:thymidylate synthase